MEKTMFVIHSKASKRGCWFIQAKYKNDVWKWLNNKIPYARTMLRWSIRPIEAVEIIPYLQKDGEMSCTITEIDTRGKEIGKKKAYRKKAEIANTS